MRLVFATRASALARWQTDGLDVESMVAVGLPFQEIAVVARDLAVDMVVMGGYGRSGRGPIEKVFFGSTAEKVVRLLPCPVLCVPPDTVSEPLTVRVPAPLIVPVP